MPFSFSDKNCHLCLLVVPQCGNKVKIVLYHNVAKAIEKQQFNNDY
jgi:hypothetical protein